MSFFHDLQKNIDNLGYIHPEISSVEAKETTAPIGGKDEYEFYASQIYIPADRRQRIMEYMEMLLYSEIGSAIEIYADTGTQVNQDGYRISVVCSDEKMKEELDNLYHVVLNYDTKMWKTFHTTCAFGDCFDELVLNKDKTAVVGTKWLPPKTMYRVEEQSKLRGFIQEVPQGEASKFMPFEIIHYRLDNSLSTFHPYGQSLLEICRRHWRQLKLMEDAMVVYRISRAPERRVFKIWTGSLPPAAAERHVEQQRLKYRKRSFVNQRSGQLDSRANSIAPDEDFWVPMRNNQEGTTIDTLPGACLALDTKIPLLDGRTISLQQIISEFNSGKINYVYSVNPKTGKNIPGLITWAGKTRKNTEVVKITLDTGKEIICTPDHKFPTRCNGKS